MTNYNEFLIENDTSKKISVAVEPEGIIVSLNTGEFLTITDNYELHPVTLRLSESPDGRVIPCIWPGDGDTIVRLNGKNVLAS